MLNQQATKQKIKTAWLGLPKTVRYLLTGGINTVAGYAIFGLCYLLLTPKIPHFLILIISHIVAVSVSFFTHSQWVFNDSGIRGYHATLRAWWRFQATYIGLLALGLIVNAVMLQWVSPSIWLAQATATATGVVSGYFLHQNIAFKKHHNKG